MTSIGRAFIDQSRTYLNSDYLPKIRRCVREIPDTELWWRPNPRSNSIGNLLLHLVGNVREWVVGGIGGEPSTRDRQTEFDADGMFDRQALPDRLEGALRDADRVLATLSAESLLEHRLIHGRGVSVLEALYHVVEHFGMHTGQIIYIVKLRTDTDLKLDEAEDAAARVRS